MISRRLSSSSASSLILDFLTNLRHSCWGHHHHRHRPRGCYSLMAACSYSLSSSLTITNNYNTDPYGLLFHSSSALKVRPCPKLVGIKSLSTNDNTNHNSNSNSRRPRALAPNVLVEQLKNCHDPIGFNKNGGYHTFGFPDPPVPEKVVVAVDVDEVLGNFVSALNRFIADRYSSDHSVSEYHVYEFFKIWNCSRDEADSRVHEFFKTSYFKTGIHPIPGARQALQKLSTFCNLSVVTSRQNAIKDHTIEWIEKHFPGLFQEIHFGNHFALEGQSRPKSEICRSLGAKVLIDDNPRYAAECAEAGIKVLLFDYENSYPWCKIESVAQHPLVVKVHNWEEVEHQLASHVVS